MPQPPEPTKLGHEIVTQAMAVAGDGPTGGPTFIWGAVNDACTVKNVQNQYPNKQSPKDALDAARAVGLTVDSVPTIGSVVFRRSTGDSAGKIGIVIAFDDNELGVIEGDPFRIIAHTWDVVKDPNNGFQFIHVDYMGGERSKAVSTPSNSQSSSSPGPVTVDFGALKWVSIALTIGAGYALYRVFK